MSVSSGISTKVPMTSWSTYSGSLLPAGGCQSPYRVCEVCFSLPPFAAGISSLFHRGSRVINPLIAITVWRCLALSTRSRSRVCNLSTSQLVEINHSDVILIADRSSQAVSLSVCHLWIRNQLCCRSSVQSFVG